MKLSTKLTIIGLVIAAVGSILVPLLLKAFEDKVPGKGMMIEQKMYVPAGSTNRTINKTIRID